MVTEARRKLRLTYTEEALATYDPGTPLLSLSLPLTTESFPNGVVRAFLDGLLPEGEARRVIAQDFGVRADDTMGLAMAVGRDCAGALVIQPEGDAPPPRPTIQTAERLTDTDLAAGEQPALSATRREPSRADLAGGSAGEAAAHPPRGWGLGPPRGRDTLHPHPQTSDGAVP